MKKKTKTERLQEYAANEKINSMQGHALAVCCDGDFQSLSLNLTGMSSTLTCLEKWM